MGFRGQVFIMSAMLSYFRVNYDICLLNYETFKLHMRL